VDAVLAVLFSGAMWYGSAGINHVWPLAWLAPAPLLIVLPGLKPWRATLAAFAAACGGAASFVVAYWGAMPLWMLALMVPAMAAPYAAAAMGWRAVARRSGPVVTALAYAAFVTLEEWLVAQLSPNGTFGSVAYSQADVLAVIQLGSLTGLAGITFVVALVGATLAVMWRERDSRSTREAALGVAALLVAATLVYGDLRLAAAAPARVVRIGLVASDSANRPFTTDGTEALRVARGYAARASLLAERDLQFIVLPEKFVAALPGDDYGARVALASVARRWRLTLAAGFNVTGRAQPRNLAVVFGPDGRTLLEYDKVHLVPGLERGYARGALIGVVPDTAVTAGVAICKDMDFPALGRTYARAGVQLMLVPAWDFGRDAWLHSRMAVLRGVEGGFAVARSASDGLLTVSDARGRVVAERATDAAGEVLVAGAVRAGPAGTFYSRTGDWFAALVTLVAVLCVLDARRRPVAGPGGPGAGQRSTLDRQPLPR